MKRVKEIHNGICEARPFYQNTESYFLKSMTIDIYLRFEQKHHLITTGDQAHLASSTKHHEQKKKL